MARSRNRVRITVSGELEDWIAALDDLGAGPLALEEWGQATERFFAKTQRAVHIDTGELISTGYQRTERTGTDQVTGEVGYTAAYAVYEFARGGNHDALRQGWRGMTTIYEEALMAGIMREFRRPR